MDPEIGNGLLVVSWAITAWGPQSSGGNISKITKTTFAVIQNIYKLMSGTAMFNVNKSFSKDSSTVQIEKDQIGTCYITLKNNAIYPIEGFSIADTLSRCFEYLYKSGGLYEPIPTISQIGGKTILNWSGIVLPPDRGSITVQFDYKVNYNPPCN